MIAFIAMLIVISIVDIKKREIPNGFIMIIGIIGVMAMVFQDHLTFANRLLGFFCISLPLLIIAMIKPNAFGGGDIKLMAVCGFYLGVIPAILSFFIAVMVGGIYGVWLLIKKNGREKEFAFGPFLCGGIGIVLFFETQIMKWLF